MDKWENWLKPVIELAKAGGEEILHYFAKPVEQMGVSKKADNTFLTKADVNANALICKGLKKLTPEIPILSEENAKPVGEVRHAWSFYWLIDPLDGTRGFVNQSEDFTVNIALIADHRPVMGVVYVPVKQRCYFATAGHGAYHQEGEKPPVSIQTKPICWEAYQVLLGQYLQSSRLLTQLNLDPAITVMRLNSSLKFCLIAEGKGDIYPRLGDTHEWDTGAAQCVLEEAGGAVLDFKGQSLQYNTRHSLVNPPFIAMGDRHQQVKIIELINRLRG